MFLPFKRHTRIYNAKVQVRQSIAATTPTTSKTIIRQAQSFYFEIKLRGGGGHFWNCRSGNGLHSTSDNDNGITTTTTKNSNLSRHGSICIGIYDGIPRVALPRMCTQCRHSTLRSPGELLSLRPGHVQCRIDCPTQNLHCPTQTIARTRWDGSGTHGRTSL